MTENAKNHQECKKSVKLPKMLKLTEYATNHRKCRKSLKMPKIKKSQKSPKMPKMTQNIAKISNAVQCHSLLSGNKDCKDFRFSIVITFDPELRFRFPRWVSESTDRRGSAGEVRNLSGDFRNTEIRCGNTRNTVCNATSARSFSASRTPILLSKVSFGIYGSEVRNPSGDVRNTLHLC